MVLDGARREHGTFADVARELRAGDVLVLNETRVIAARLRGTRAPSGGAVELFLLGPADGGRYDPAQTRWRALARPARRLRAGELVEFGGGGRARIVAELPDGVREVAFELDEPFEAFLERAGRTPLPPYVRESFDAAPERYQTVFARVPGSVAAPTASLHFTTQLLERIEGCGVDIVRLVLDVGLGTFRPIATERIDDHRMHAERYAIGEEAAAAIERARAQGRRIVAAGTTVVRALEGNIQKHGSVVPGEDETDLFITPGFRFRAVDAMITNFHLPGSSLLVLVSAFAGRDAVLDAYREAVRLRYRFFSFGDAMFVTRAVAP